MTSITKRLVNKGTRHALKYEEELVHSAMAVSQNAIICMAKKVEDNVLLVMTVPVYAPQPITAQNPVATPLCTLLKAPNALIIK